MSTIDLSATTSITYNGKVVNNLYLNSDLIWPVKEYTKGINYTGLDANGNLEGSQDFDGTIVAYAVGNPTITISTDDDGNETESISYLADNGYNDEYYGQKMTSSMGSDDYDESWFVVPTSLVIPKYRNGKKVTKILPSAFYGCSYGSESSATYQAGNIKTVDLPDSIEEIGSYAFLRIRSLINCDFLHPGLKEIGAYAFRECGFYQENWNNTDFLPDGLETLSSSSLADMILWKYYTTSSGTGVMGVTDTYEISLPKSLKKISSPFCYATSTSESNYAGVVNVYSESLSMSNGFDSCKVVKFKESCKSLSGSLTYNNSPSVLVFEHVADAEIVLDLSGGPKGAVEMDIYSDNTIVNEFDWSSLNITATLHALSEYEG